MTALLSILALLTAWAILASMERLPWPITPQSALHDQEYWQAVQRDTAAYLATHSNVSDTVRSTVETMAIAANQKLQGIR